MMGRWGYGTGMGGGGWLGLLLTAFFGALILAGLVVLVIWAVRAAGGGSHHRYAMHGGYAGHGPVGTAGGQDTARHQAAPGPDFVGPGPAGGGAARTDDALEIARRRFAAGEITKEQYDELVNALRR